jgi:hypothetical protein
MINKLLLSIVIIPFIYTSRSSCEIIDNYLYNYGSTPIYIYVNGNYQTYAPIEYNNPVYVGDFTREDIIRGYYKYRLICSN